MGIGLNNRSMAKLILNLVLLTIASSCLLSSETQHFFGSEVMQRLDEAGNAQDLEFLDHHNVVILNKNNLEIINIPSGNVTKKLNFDFELTKSSLLVIDSNIYLIGGKTDGSPTDKVFKINTENDLISLDFVSRLPDTLWLATAVEYQGKIVVVGGQVGPFEEENFTKIFIIDPQNSLNEWEEIEAPFRILKPSVVAVAPDLFIIGGWSIKDGQLTPSAEGWRYRFKPMESVTEVGWKKIADMPLAVGSSIMQRTGQAHVVAFGGINERFSSLVDIGSNSSKSNKIQIYHTVTDQWVLGGKLEEPVGIGAVSDLGNRYRFIDTSGAHLLVTPIRIVKNLRLADYAVLGVFFILVGLIGLYFSKKQVSGIEYTLAGRKTKWWAAGLSMFATSTSAVSIMAIPALVFRTNLVWLTPIFFVFIPLIVQIYFLFPVLRRLEIVSTFEYLEMRFHYVLRIIASIQNILFNLIGRTSAVMLIPALAISAVTGIDIMISVILMGAIVTFYTTIGGFSAVIWTDVVQGATMFLGMAVVIVFAVVGFEGGLFSLISTANSYGRLEPAILSLDVTLPILWIYILAVAAQGFNVAAEQPTVQRVFSTPLADLRRTGVTSALCGVLMAVICAFAGVAIFGFFWSHPELLDPSMRHDQIVPLFVVQQVPVGLAGLVIAGIFSAALSTLSSSLNSISTLVSTDFLERFLPKFATEKIKLRLMMIVTIVSGVIATFLACVMATWPIESLFQFTVEIFALIGGGFVGIFILGIFTTIANSFGVICGALASVGTIVFVKFMTTLHWAFYAPVALASCLIVGYLVSFTFRSYSIKNLDGLTIFTSK